MLARQRGIDVDQIESRVQREAQQTGEREFDSRMADRSRENAKQLQVEAYESILLDRRTTEKAELNAQRFREYEKNRPPEANWFSLTSSEFHKELYRNRVALKPHGENKAYLEQLQDPNLY